MGEISEKPAYILDCAGFECADVIQRAGQEIDRLVTGDILELIADDPEFEGEIVAWVGKTGQKVLSIDKSGNYIKFLIKKTQ